MIVKILAGTIVACWQPTKFYTVVEKNGKPTEKYSVPQIGAALHCLSCHESNHHKEIDLAIDSQQCHKEYIHKQGEDGYPEK